jgi:hypothetical protein
MLESLEFLFSPVVLPSAYKFTFPLYPVSGRSYNSSMKTSLTWISQTPLVEISQFITGQHSRMSPDEIERAESLKETE